MAATCKPAAHTQATYGYAPLITTMKWCNFIQHWREQKRKLPQCGYMKAFLTDPCR